MKAIDQLSSEPICIPIHVSIEDIWTILIWCRNNIPLDKWDYKPNYYNLGTCHATMYFDKREDATLFRLIWL